MSSSTRLFFGALALHAAISLPVHAQTVQTAKKETLLETDHSWIGEKYPHYPDGQPQLTMLKLTIAPHSALPWHTHAVPNAAYILSGTLTVHDQKSGKSITLHAGDALGESVNAVHRGVAGDEPVVVLVVYAGVVGQPTSTPVAGGQHEY